MDWLLQTSPNDYDVEAALKAGVLDGTWLAPKHQKHIAIGDTAGIWRCGPDAALLATAEILSLPERIETYPHEKQFERRPAKFEGKQWRVKVHFTPLKMPLRRNILLADRVAGNWKVLRGCQGTVFRVPPDVSAAILNIIASN